MDEEAAPQPASNELSIGLNFLPQAVRYQVHEVFDPTGNPALLLTFETAVGTVGFWFDLANAAEMGKTLMEKAGRHRLSIAKEAVLDQIVSNGQLKHG